jgi:hypothetical protein
MSEHHFSFESTLGLLDNEAFSTLVNSLLRITLKQRAQAYLNRCIKI